MIAKGERRMCIEVGQGLEGDIPDAYAKRIIDEAMTPLFRSGNVAEEIVALAREKKSDLIVMATEGRDGVLDAFRGSTTEQVLRTAPCPVLAVPAKRELD